MSYALATREIERFLATDTPEVLSVSGRWGVGKTYAWDQGLSNARATAGLRRYAYVSVFGLRSLDALKTAIVQSTVSLNGSDLEPSVDSFVEHMSSAAGLKKLGEELGRKGLGIFSRGASAVPYVGKLADLLAPGAALLIRNQIVCIDDVERAGQGLDVGDILGLVSSLRERRGCKVVLLLNEDGLGEQGKRYREYLEKVVDQAVRFEPTPAESAAGALQGKDALTPEVARRTVALGVTNIRVIRRIRRFLSFIEPDLADLHQGVADRVIGSMVLLGWCVFEPALAPPLDQVRSHSRYAGLISDNDNRSLEQKRTDRMLQEFGFGSFDEIDRVILVGLQSGAFDRAALSPLLQELDVGLRKGDVRAAIARPWSLFEDSLDDNAPAFLDALGSTLEAHAKDMDPQEASDALAFIRDLGRPEEADRLLGVYVEAQRDRPREFFAARMYGYSRPIDPGISQAFEKRLAELPLIRDPAEVLLEIGAKNGWNPKDVSFLASVPVSDYCAMLERLRGSDLHDAITVALRFGEMTPADEVDREVARRMTEALTSFSIRSEINRLRLRRYLGAPNDGATAEPGDLAQTTKSIDDPGAPIGP